MRDGGINQTEKLTLGSGRIIEDLLRNVDEADHNFNVLGCLCFYERLLDLEEFEFRDKLVIDVFH